MSSQQANTQHPHLSVSAEMAETQQVQDECNQVNQDLVKVLASEAVPIHSTDLDREDASKKFFPLPFFVNFVLIITFL